MHLVYHEYYQSLELQKQHKTTYFKNLSNIQ